jgi:RNA-binding protein YhbY
VTESFIAEIGKLLETKQCIKLTIFFVCRTTSKKKCDAMVSTKRNTEEQFGKPQEAKIEVFGARSIVFSYSSDSWVDRMTIHFYEIQNTATLSEVKIVLKGGQGSN